MFIREITPTDTDAAARLSAELGYPTAVEEMQQRIVHSINANDRIVYVACGPETVVGWIEVCVVHHLASGTSAEISGLIVSANCRSTGIGQELVRKAEQWASAQGISRMVVRSRVTREAAHRFYLREGYSLTKTSAVFSKPLKA